MQAIRTRYYGPTSTRGARMTAKCHARTVSVSYDHKVDIDANHRAAFNVLRFLMEWTTPEYAPAYGGEFGGDTYWVFTHESAKM